MSTMGGVLVVLGIALALLALGFLGHWLVHRFGRTKAKSLEHDPHPPGRVGRVGKERGP